MEQIEASESNYLDAHIHVWEYCLFQSFASLEQAGSMEEIIALLKAHPQNGWAVGVRFNQENLTPQTIPDRNDLDRYFGSQPAVIVRTCLHMMMMNTAAMESLGYYSENGIFLEADVFAILNHLARVLTLSPERIVKEGMASLQALGITDVIDMGMDKTKRPYFEHIDFYTTDWDLLEEAHGYKLFLDGSFGARTSALSAPYSDDPHNYGVLNYTLESLLALVEKVHNYGKPVACHAIGDRAVEQFLEVMKRSRHPGDRIEHVQYATHEQLDTLSRLQIPVCIQPIASSELSWARQRLGAQRMETAYAWNLMLQKGIFLLAGSDAPVDNADPRFAARLVNGLEGNQHLDYEQALNLYAVNNRQFYNKKLPLKK